MLKPALAGGRIRVIGATTESEYNTYIQSDAALERRFQPIRIDELAREATLQVLRARTAQAGDSPRGQHPRGCSRNG